MTALTSSTPRFQLPEPDIVYPERGFASLIRCSWLEGLRLLLKWFRDPTTIIQSTVYPAVMLLMLRVVLGDSISAATGQSSVYGTVPMIMIVGAMSGATVSALSIGGDRISGLLSRMWTLPIYRASVLLGRVLAEMVRVLVTSLVIAAVGLLLGFRFHQGPLAAIGLFCIPILFGVGFALFVAAVTTNTSDSDGMQMVQIIAALTMLLMFFNTGFVPLAAYPPWLQAVVAHQPMSCAIDAMKGLSLGGPVAGPLLQTIAWSLGTLAICVLPAIRGFRRAAGTS